MKTLKSISWGNNQIDGISKGIPANDLAVLEAKDHRSSIVLLGKLIFESLKNGEVCVLVTHQPFQYFNEVLLHFNIDLSSFVKSNRLIHLTYHPNIKLIMGTTQNYQELLEEIFTFCDGAIPSRIIFHQVDALINLSNSLVMNISVSKLGEVARSELSKNTSIMTSFVCYPDSTHYSLSYALQKVASGYYTCDLNNSKTEEGCHFKVIKQPWFDYSTKEEIVNLSPISERIIKRAQ